MRELGTVLSGGSIYPIAQSAKLSCVASDGQYTVPLQIMVHQFNNKGDSLFGEDRLTQETDLYQMYIVAEHTSVYVDAASSCDQRMQSGRCVIHVLPGDEIAINISFQGVFYTRLPRGLEVTDRPSAVIRYNGLVDGKQQFTVVSNDRCAFYVYSDDSDFV